MPKGKAPSLISASNGGLDVGESKIRSTCSRCKVSLPGGSRVGLLKVQQAGFSNQRRLCLGCAGDVIERTQLDLDAIRARFEIEREG
jgi:hypothetical protein